VIQPLQVLQDIHRVRPDLLIIDLDIKEISGSELAQVIAQHRECRHFADDPAVFPGGYGALPGDLDAAGRHLLVKPAPPAICAGKSSSGYAARACAGQAEALLTETMGQRLFNRRRFLMLLEQAIDTLGLRAQSLAVVFVDAG
jgi:CheY-like chemotaxis protein